MAIKKYNSYLRLNSAIKFNANQRRESHPFSKCYTRDIIAGGLLLLIHRSDFSKQKNRGKHFLAALQNQGI
jgi:hypothetical protein